MGMQVSVYKDVVDEYLIWCSSFNMSVNMNMEHELQLDKTVKESTLLLLVSLI